jgi:dTMP kinase
VGDGAPPEGRFITLEGPDGAGKSSQAARLADALRAEGRVVVSAREPGGTPLGEVLRSLLLAGDQRGDDPLTDALLFLAARSRLVRDVIRPALERGEIVVCDRFTDSTLAYQGYGSGLPVERLRELDAWATGGLRPDLTILLDLPAAAGLARRAGGPAGERTRFEEAGRHDSEFHERVRAGYLELAAAEPERWRVVDGQADPATVAERVLAAVLPLVGATEPIGPSVRISS